jgi:glycosyltransferase involved in cell wall biosynthesis
MRLLVVSPFLPFPPDSGGSIRVYNIIHALSQNHELSLLSYVRSDDGSFVKQLEALCPVIQVPFEPSRRRSLCHATQLLSKLPFSLVFKDPLFKEKLAECAAQNFDVVQFEFLPFAHYIDFFPEKTLRVVVEHYIATQARAKLLSLWPPGIKKLYYTADLFKIRRYEREILRKFDLCLVTSQQDREYLINWCQLPNVMVSPNGVDIDFFSPQHQLSDETDDMREPTLVYMGSFDLDPANTDALVYLIEDIWPLIKKEVPAVRLEVLGKGLPPEFLDNYCDKNIQFRGYLEDIRPVLKRADVFVLPLRGGSGTKIRILTAMAMGLPVVASETASAGIEVQPGKNILIGNSPARFANQTVSILRGNGMKQEIGLAGRRLVEKKYSWTPIAQALENRYLELIGRRDFEATPK